MDSPQWCKCHWISPHAGPIEQHSVFSCVLHFSVILLLAHRSLFLVFSCAPLCVGLLWPFFILSHFWLLAGCWFYLFWRVARCWATQHVALLKMVRPARLVQAVIPILRNPGFVWFLTRCSFVHSRTHSNHILLEIFLILLIFNIISLHIWRWKSKWNLWPLPVSLIKFKWIRQIHVNGKNIILTKLELNKNVLFILY